MKKMKLVVIMILCLNLVCLGSAYAADKVKWRMQSFLPATTNLHQYLQEFCNKVKEQTGGRMEITLFPGNSLFPNLKVFKNVKAGVVDIAHSSVVYYPGEYPESLTFSPPYGLMHFDDNYALWYYGGLKELADSFYKKNGLLTRGRLTIGAEPIYSRVPIRTINDFKGKKIRMTGASARFFDKKLGASTVVIGPGDLFTALNNGTVDACEFTGGSLDYALGLHKAASYIIMPTYLGAGLTEFLINNKAYEKLPEDIRKTFDLCCTWAELHISHKMLRDNQIALKKMVSEGDMEVIWLPEEDMSRIRKLAVEFWDEELSTISPNAKKMMDLYKGMAKERGIIK